MCNSIRNLLLKNGDLFLYKKIRYKTLGNALKYLMDIGRVEYLGVH